MSLSDQSKTPGRLARAWDSDIAWSFRHSPVMIRSTRRRST